MTETKAMVQAKLRDGIYSLSSRFSLLSIIFFFPLFTRPVANVRLDRTQIDTQVTTKRVINKLSL